LLFTLTFWPPVTSKPHLRIACDGLSVINRLSNPKPIDSSEPHADLLTAARNLLITSAYKIELAFVHGHQDNGVPTVLARDAWLNIEADQLAKTKMSHLHTGPIVYKLPGNPWSCYAGTNWVVKQFQQSLRKFINGKDTLLYWERKKQYPPDIIQQVDWQSFGRAMREVPVSKRRWVSKWTSSHFGHGKHMVRWKQCTTAECPRCSTHLEDKSHVLVCPHPDSHATWTTAVTALQKGLRDSDTAPHLTKAITTSLLAWQHGDQPQDSSPPSRQQQALGWGAVLDCWIGLEWRAQQEAYWLQWRRRKSSKCWAMELIKKLWNISWDMWDHHNGILHNASQSREDILDSAINDQLRILHGQGLHAIPRDAFHLFSQSVNNLIAHQRHYKVQWVASVEAVITRKQHHDHGSYLSEQRFMRRWLGLD